jgi:predicted RNA-binding Zn ribbon-like protein
MAVGADLGSRLGICSAPACDRVYIDLSKNSMRRFCSTRCQNRVKTAAYRSRARS